MITVITPFKRRENVKLMADVLKGKCHWIVLQSDDEEVIDFPSWVTVKRLKITNKKNISNRLFNEFVSQGLDDETQYMVLCDDDAVEDGFFDKIPNEDCVLVSMKRTDRVGKHIVWDDWHNQISHWENGLDVLIASPDNLKIARVGGEQLILKGKVLKKYRYGLHNIGDGEMILQVSKENDITYVPDAYVLFNYYEDGRYQSFKRKPLVMFVGDYFCAANPKMGLSEWETNIYKSLDSTGLADVLTFHFDKYFYHYGKRGDEALLKAIEQYKPDYVVCIIYKELGSDPFTISLPTLSSINSKIVTIWGDLEAEEQLTLAHSIESLCWKIVGTANKTVCERYGYTYLHVPKDPRIFNNPDFKRDIDIVFSGSYGYGREERQRYMLHLLNNGIKLIHGGSEGGDHFTTEEYADRYKRAKLALSFSQARGMNVVNARPFEAMSCGAMLLEQESLELAKLYIPFVDYVPWTTEDDLLNKVKYYLEHEDERRIIASNGYEKTLQTYSAKTFWEKVLS